MEYYGPKPKKFTKEWWPYFWDYYKWHTIAVVAAIVAIVATVVQVATQKKYDGNLVVAGNVAFPYEYGEKLETALNNASDDIDANGEKAILVETVTFSSEDIDAQMAGALRQKYDIKLSTDESFAFIMDKELLKQTVESETTGECIVPVSQWLTEKVSEENIYILNGKGYAVNLSDSKILSEIGLPDYEVYAVLKHIYNPEDEKMMKEFENAKKLLNALCVE